MNSAMTAFVPAPITFAEGEICLTEVPDEEVFPALQVLLDRSGHVVKQRFEELDDLGNGWLPPPLLLRIIKLEMPKCTSLKVNLNSENLR